MINKINRSLLMNTTSVIYDLLAKIGSKHLTNAVSSGKFSENQTEYYMKQYKFSDYEISLCSVQNDFPKDIEFITL